MNEVRTATDAEIAAAAAEVPELQRRAGSGGASAAMSFRVPVAELLG